MALQACGKRVVVEPIKDESRSPIITVTENGPKPPARGKIISVGPQCENGLKVGEVVHYAPFMAHDLVGHTAKALFENDIFAVETAEAGKTKKASK